VQTDIEPSKPAPPNVSPPSFAQNSDPGDLLKTALDSLLQLNPCVLFTQRPDFSVAFATPNLEPLTGISQARGTAPPTQFWDLVHELDAPELRRQIKHAAEAGAAVTTTYRIRHALTGRVTHVQEQRRPVLDRAGRLLGYEVAWQDVTRRSVAEKRLATAAWKETLAVLTLGLVHDFRNIVAGIHSLSESFLAQIDSKNPFHEGLSLIKQNSLQASELIQRVISLHLGQAGERTYHDLNTVVSDLADLMGRIVKRRIKVTLELAPGQLPIHADLVELRQVVINLMLNAAEAMPDGGQLTLRTSCHENLPPLAYKKGVLPRLPCLCLAIQDTGSGIKEEHLQSVFISHFTTKAKGSGFGLYNAQLAIEKHRGLISVESQPGLGACFTIWLPRADFSESAENTTAPTRVRRSLLLLGQPGETLDQTAEFLRLNNYQVVLAHAPETLGELLDSDDYVFSAVLILVGPNDSPAPSLLAEIRRARSTLKIALKLAGRSLDDLDGRLLSGTDLVLNSDLPQADTLTKLENLLDEQVAQ
jgi:signal transduction histidine kinase